MNNFRHPNFILGLFTLLLLFIGVGLRANGYVAGDYVWLAAFGLGAIHWIWAIVDVISHYKTKIPTENLHIFWVILVVIIPAAGSLMYYALGRRVSI